ncbi:MAG: hypothetical protein JWM25_833 [Thermoleophilia bacterium]|nr:hypothetical protein [Thermoleophilia bacterium]
MLAARRSLLVSLLIIGILAALAPSALAADTYAAPVAQLCNSGRGSGGTDTTGVLYAACGPKIVRLDATGKRLPDITITGLAYGSVAPSPDGRYLYIGTPSLLRRLDRQANGTYKLSTTWLPGRFTLGGTTHQITPRNLKTDEFGNIYVSNAGTNAETKKLAETRILKLSPDGKVMTAFGEHGNAPTNPYSFFQNRGLTVSRDGRMLFVTSHLQGQIRRFDIQANGSYAYKLTIGKLDTNCDTAGGLSAVSDVGIDPWGFVYAADTTCGKIKKFRSDGTLVGTIAISTPKKVLHEIAVNRRGDVFAGEWNKFYPRAAANPVPGPIPAITKPVIDITAPVLTTAILPVNVTQRDVIIDVLATDAVGVRGARVANEDGTWGAWKAFDGAKLPHQLTAGLGYKTVYVQVRDAAGNVAAATALASTRVVAADTPPVVPGAPVDATAPVLTAVAVPATTTTQAITINITATDNVKVTQVRFANEDGNWLAWKAFTPAAAHTLSAGYAVKGVYTQVRDAAGHESVSIYKTLRYQAGAAAPAPAPAPAPGADPAPAPAPAPAADAVAPVLVGFTLPAITTTQAITLTITATDNIKVTQVRVANEDGNWGAWKAFTPNLAHTLSGGHSVKGVYVQVRDAAGNESGAIYKTLRFQAAA